MPPAVIHAHHLPRVAASVSALPYPCSSQSNTTILNIWEDIGCNNLNMENGNPHVVSHGPKDDWKSVYCDESRAGAEPVAVMVGLIVDAQRMHVTKNDWKNLLIDLSRVVGPRREYIGIRRFLHRWHSRTYPLAIIRFITNGVYAVNLMVRRVVWQVGGFYAIYNSRLSSNSAECIRRGIWQLL